MRELNGPKKSLLILATAVAYFVAAQLGLFWVVEGANVTPLWPAAGIGVASLFAFGWHMWLGVFVGSFSSAALHLAVFEKLDVSVSLIGAFMIAGGTALEALAIWHLAGKWKIRENLFDSVSGIFKFVPITFLTCLVSSSVGAFAIQAMGINAPQSEPITFVAWWLGETLAILIFTPLLMSWWPLIALKKGRELELVAAFGALLTVCFFVFGEMSRLAVVTSLPSFAGPVLLWLAFRFSKREVLTGVSLFSLVAIYATTRHQGPFASPSMIESFLSLQLFCAMVAVSMLVLSATVKQNADYQRELRENNETLEQKVQQRTQELEKKTRILEAINTQLVVEAKQRQAAERRLRDLETTQSD